jgi:hypothetical protein
MLGGSGRFNVADTSARVSQLANGTRRGLESAFALADGVHGFLETPLPSGRVFLAASNNSCSRTGCRTTALKRAVAGT